MKRVVTAGTAVNRDQIKLDFMNYMLDSYEAEIDGASIGSTFDRIVKAAKQGFGFDKLAAWAAEEGMTLVEVLDAYENEERPGEDLQDDFHGWNIKDLRFYYKDHIDRDEFPTFPHWVEYLHKNGQFG